jgi:hypothetical protein
MFSGMRSRIETFFVAVARLALASALALSGVLLPAIPAQAQATPQVRTGLLNPVATFDPLHAPVAPGLAPQAAAPSYPKGARPIHTVQSAASRLSQAPQADSISVNAPNARSLLHNFNGVGSLDSGVTNFGAEFEPPDQGLCVGNGFVVEPVNSAFTIYRRTGSVVAGPFNVNVMFNEGLTEFTSDPRCYYDQATHTWFAIILFINDAFTAARTDIAVNTSGDPTTPWTVYHLDATDDGTNGTPSHPGCPCLGDQPLLGIDQDNLYISTNEFSLLGPEFNGTQLYAIAKADLVALTTAHFVMYENLTIAGQPAASVQPALTNGDSPAEYFLSSLDPDGTTDNRLGVWALTNTRAVARGGTPTLSSVVINSETYGIPPAAIQQGSTSLLDSGDDRMQQVQYLNGELWGALGTIVTPAKDTDARAGIAWFRVRPRLNGRQIGSARMIDQGYVAARGNYLLYPAIQASSAGTVGLVFALSGPNNYGSAAYAVMTEDQHSFGRINLAAAGTGPYDPNATRWGDYSFGVLDPSGNSFWFATEYIPPQASQTADGRRNWGTRVIEVDARTP